MNNSFTSGGSLRNEESLTNGNTNRNEEHLEKYPVGALVPKKPTQADTFLKRYPEYDGRGIVVAIFDTGVDPGSVGLSKTSDGKKKIIDIVDATGSGDVKMDPPIKIPDDRTITSKSGRKLIIPHSHLDDRWTNPSEEIRLGFKRAYEIFPKDLETRVSKLHKEKHEAIQADLLADLKQSLMNTTDQRKKNDIESKVSHLESLMNKYKDPGPILDIVSWHDGTTWRAVVVSSDEDKVNLANFKPMAAYKIEYEFSTFSQEDLMNYSLNFYDNGSIVSIVTTAGSHGTHVCGIVGAYHEDEPELNGIAPGAQFVSVKIGDSRLGSMETGTGLVRGLIAAKESGCHIINMSYGEPTSIPNSGRFSNLVKKLINEHGIIFVSSAGNAGPCSSTVGAPAATTPGLISVGAHVTEDMMEVQYSLRETLPQNHFSWSSRGPSKDGAIGVNISCPGCSISPVPNYTLSKNMRMNGTSMSSPNACGGISLLLSSLKAQRKHWNPYYIQKAIENTALPIVSVNPLAMGYGLLQIEDAFDYIQEFPYDPQLNMWFTINCQKKDGRGIYLREYFETETEYEEIIEIEPHFQKDTDNINKLNFERRLRILSNQDWIQVPKFLHLSNNSKTFVALIDPTKLEPGQIHLGEIVAVNADDSSEGPIFRIPVTVMKPQTLPVNSFRFRSNNISLEPASLQRYFIVVPKGARLATFTVESEDYTPHSKRTLILHAIQLLPKESYNHCEIKHFFISHPYEKKTFGMSVHPNVTLEIVVGQFWSSLGSSTVNLTVEFDGITIPNEITMLESVGTVQIASELKNQNVSLKAQFDKLCWHVKPSDSDIICRKDSRNLLFTNNYIQDLTLKYNFSVNENGKYTIRVPILQTLLYESEFESSMLQIFQDSKKLIHTNDFRPKPCQLKKGDYVAILHIRHDKLSYLEAKKDLSIIVEKNLSSTLPVTIYKGSINNALIESKSNKVTQLFLPKGISTKLYITSPKVSSLKDLKQGMWLEGSFQWNPENLSSSSLKYIIQPEMKVKSKCPDEAKEIKKLDTRTPQEMLKDALIDERVKITKSLLKEKPSDGEILLSTLLDAYPRDLRVLNLKLEYLFDKNPKPYNEIVSLTDVIAKCIDSDNLAIFFGTLPSKVDPFDYAHKKELQEKKQKKEYLITCLNKRSIALLNLAIEHKLNDSEATNSPYDQEIDKAVHDLRKWANTKTAPHLLVDALYSYYLGYYGETLEIMKSFIIDQKDEFSSIEKELNQLEEQIYNKLGWESWNIYRKKWNLIDNPPDFPLFS